MSPNEQKVEDKCRRRNLQMNASKKEDCQEDYQSIKMHHGYPYADSTSCAMTRTENCPGVSVNGPMPNLLE